MEKQLNPKEMINSGLCIGCGICIADAPEYGKTLKMEFDSYGQYRPFGSDDLLEKSTEKFTVTCPFSPVALNEDKLSEILFPAVGKKSGSIGKYLSNWIGFVAEDDFRKEGSSGGLTTWILTELKKKDLIDGVAHVVSVDPEQTKGKFFQYRISYTEKEIKEGAKSRYYPVELSGILNQIRNTNGRYAIVAVPCMIKAIQLLRLQDPILKDRICFTAALFCGHMKSARFVESFAWQMNVPLNEIQSIDFRYKMQDRPANWYIARVTLRNGRQVQKDWWHLADGDWGAGFFMNSACNFCDDVVGETADFSTGDAWIEPYTSDDKGTNVLIIRRTEIQQLIIDGIMENRLDLKEVSKQIVEQTQAAGFRQRRQGLAYRLLWVPHGIQPNKRVLPDAKGITKPRKRIYWMRFMISKWSHRIFWLSRKSKQPTIYLSWARAIASLYYGISYHQGKLNQIKKRHAELKK